MSTPPLPPRHRHCCILSDPTRRKFFDASTELISAKLAQDFPPLEASSLSGKTVRFPGVLKGGVSLVGVFHRGSGFQMMSSWLEPFEEAFGIASGEEGGGCMGAMCSFLQSFSFVQTVGGVLGARTRMSDSPASFRACFRGCFFHASLNPHRTYSRPFTLNIFGAEISVYESFLYCEMRGCKKFAMYSPFLYSFFMSRSALFPTTVYSPIQCFLPTSDDSLPPHMHNM